MSELRMDMTIFTISSMITLLPIMHCSRTNAARSDICDRFPALAWCNDAQTRMQNPSVSEQQISDINSADKDRYCTMYEKDFYNDCSAPIRTDFNRIKFCKAFFNYCNMAAKLAPLGKPMFN